MLVLAIAATIGWIAFDVVISIATGANMNPTEWYTFVIGGVGLGSIALMGEIASWFSQERERNELMRKIETTAASQSGKMELLAIVQAIQMKTPITSEVAVAAVPAVQITNAEIEESAEEVKELHQRLRKELSKWPVMTEAEVKEFIDDNQLLKGRTVCVVPTLETPDCNLVVKSIRSALIEIGAVVTDRQLLTREIFNALDIFSEGVQIYAATPSIGFAWNLNASFEGIFDCWSGVHELKDVRLPDDLVILQIGRRWPSRSPNSSSDYDG